jgi:replicative DNA helicase
VESRDDKRPQLSDLRESGAIEQDADIVCFIHRPEYYRITEDERGNSLIGIAEIIVAKHRNGPTGIASMRFDNEYARFKNLDDYAVGQKYVERPSRMNNQVKNTGQANDVSDASGFLSQSKEPLPF